MKNHIVMQGLLIVGLHFIVGTLSAVIPGPMSNVRHMKHITATDQDHGTELRLHLGDELTVRLEAIPGTGYTWKILGGAEEVLSQVGETVFEKSSTQLVGGVEQQIFRFRVKATGMRQLEFKYCRPWDKSGIAAKSYFVKLHIEE
jgi:predicted secreted protein